MKRIYWSGSALLTTILILWRLLSGNGGGGNELYEFTTIERGDLENVISGTGTLSAVGTVEVGTQVSGTIDEVFVDFNDIVIEDQILAVLDTTLLAAAVDDARAGVLKSQALYDQSINDFHRDSDLFEKGFITEVQFQVAQTETKTAEAALLSSRANLRRAHANLSYAVIRSPIDGKAIQRNVEPGQTVAASFSTPTLFLLTEDLSQMEILGLVDESDIGRIVEGMAVRFTVEAHWDRTFHGTVRQIRLQPETIQNVVNYTVVIDAPNEGGLLYPGMTATIDFISESVEDALLVSNKALRIQPSTAMMNAMRARMEESMKEMPEGARGIVQRMQREGDSPRGFSPFGRMMGSGGEDDERAHLWIMDEDEEIFPVPVRKGATDGVKTQITPWEGRGRGGNPPISIQEGMQVISNVISHENETQTEKSNGALFGRRMGPP